MEYNITWSTLTLSPIVEYMVMYRIYQVEKYSWRIITVPKRKLPRGFIVAASHTLKGLEPNVAYEMKVAVLQLTHMGRGNGLNGFISH